jgi:tetratricopeptide (TPR) repeat protein
MDAQMDLAYDLYKHRKFAKSVDVYEAVIRKEPENAIAYLGLSDSLYSLKEYKRSYEAVQKADALQPDLAGIHFRKAVILFYWKQIQESEDEIKRSLELDPNSSESLALFAVIQFIKKDDPNGLSLLQKSLEADPNNWDAHARMGYYWARKQKFKEAALEYQKSFKLHPSFRNGFSIVVMLVAWLWVVPLLIYITALFYSVIIRNLVPALPFIGLGYVGFLLLLKQKKWKQAAAVFVISTIELAAVWIGILFLSFILSKRQ